jgi:hypothetical protein
MEEMQIPKNLINLVQDTMRNSEYQMKVQAMISKSQPIKKACSRDATACSSRELLKRLFQMKR